ncbi:hypothetical protein ACOMHN_039598 [Nucella lapillus]
MTLPPSNQICACLRMLRAHGLRTHPNPEFSIVQACLVVEKTFDKLCDCFSVEREARVPMNDMGSWFSSGAQEPTRTRPTNVTVNEDDPSVTKLTYTVFNATSYDFTWQSEGGGTHRGTMQARDGDTMWEHSFGGVPDSVWKSLSTPTKSRKEGARAMIKISHPRDVSLLPYCCAGVDWSSEPNPSPVDCAKWSSGVDWGSEPQSFPCDCDSAVLVLTGVVNLILLLWTVPSGVVVSTGVVNPNLSPVTCDSAVLHHASGDVPHGVHPALNYGWSGP